MTETTISLLSIVIGMLGSLTFANIKPQYSLNFTGNLIAGVFASILIIKTFGRLGFNPTDISTQQQVNYWLLFLNLSISFISGCLGIFLIYNLKKKLSNK